MKLRLFGETLTKFILASENIRSIWHDASNRINTLRREGLLEPELIDMFETLRRKGNHAVHEAGYGKTEEAKLLVRLAFRLSVRFMEVYGDWDFQEPVRRTEQKEVIDSTKLQQEYDEKVKT